MKRRQAFTLIELLVVVAIIGLLLSILLPALAKVQETARRRICGTQIRGVGTAMFTYAANYRDSFPKWDGSDDGSVAGKGFQPDRDKGTYTLGTDNPTAALWLLVRDASIGPNQFICPSTVDVPDPMTIDGTEHGAGVAATRTWDVYHRRHLSYSMPDMYHPQLQRQWRSSSQPNWVLLADVNDGPDPLHEGDESQNRARRNSQNHAGDGQSVLFGDNSVLWLTDTMVGPGRDNIYSYDTIVDGVASGTGKVGTDVDLAKYTHTLEIDAAIDTFLVPLDDLPPNP